MTVNKIDRCFLELMLDPEEAFLSFRRVVENANVIMATYADEALGDTQVRGRCGVLFRGVEEGVQGQSRLGGSSSSLLLHQSSSSCSQQACSRSNDKQPTCSSPCQPPTHHHQPAGPSLLPSSPTRPPPQVYPEAGTVSFSAGLHGWAFTLTVFAKLYAKKFGVEEKKMMERLWGDNFFDPATKKWTTKATGTATCKRGFCQVRPAAAAPRQRGALQQQQQQQLLHGVACRSSMAPGWGATAADPWSHHGIIPSFLPS